ncbi:NADP-dependent oxidoreductase [Streptomyces sp. NPDC048288]|uniref:NADP-dependent oxidoreductase n=1 Tax=Streptomyces sp. NPDC048288 TaxID=3365529 RepID=UPI00371B0FE0
MRIVGLTEFGGPEQLRVLDVPEPHPGPGEVRIRVHAAAVNPADIGTRSRAWNPNPHWRPPYVLGMDAAGVVSEVGEGAPWKVGDHVMAVVIPWGPGGGAYADEVVVPAESVVRIPRDLDFFHACALPMNGLTAVMALATLELPEGQVLAVTGSAGAFGGYVTQMAKAQGLRVVADASAADEASIRSLGADEVVRRGDDFAERVREVVPDGVDAVVDGALQNGMIERAVRDKGQIFVPSPWIWQAERGITVRNALVQDGARNTAGLDRVRELAERGALTPRVADILPAERAGDAHRRLEAGGVRGRLVLDFGS